MEDKISFPSDGHEIEGRLEKSSLQKGVVITHPLTNGMPKRNLRLSAAPIIFT